MVQGGAGARGQAPGDGAGNAASLQATDPSAPPAAQQRRRGPAITEPAKSVAIASKNFFKGMRDTMHEAASSTQRSNLPWDIRAGPPSSVVGMMVLAVGQGLTDLKSGRTSKEDERAAAERKPRAFLLQAGHIPSSSMQKILLSAIEPGRPREGSPPADVTVWQDGQEAERWFADRKRERAAFVASAAKESAESGGESTAAQADEPSGKQRMPPPPTDLPPPARTHPIMTGLITPEQEARARAATADISKWLREDCGSALDEYDMHRVLTCLCNSDNCPSNREALFSLEQRDVESMLTPIREYGLKNYILQKFKRRRLAGCDE